MSLPRLIVAFSYEKGTDRFRAEFIDSKTGFNDQKFLTSTEMGNLEGYVDFDKVYSESPTSFPYSAQDLWDDWEMSSSDSNTNFEDMLVELLEKGVVR
jgi:hypothetical protein